MVEIRDLQESFQERVLPLLEEMSRRYLRCYRDPHRREDVQAEAVALAWREWFRLAELDRDLVQLVVQVAYYSLKRAMCGRRVCGGPRLLEPLSSYCQQRRDSVRISIPIGGEEEDHSADQRAALESRRGAEPWQHAIVGIDWPEWQRYLPSRQRLLLQLLTAGMESSAIAVHWRVSSRSVRKRIRDLKASWAEFCS